MPRPSLSWERHRTRYTETAVSTQGEHLEWTHPRLMPCSKLLILKNFVQRGVNRPSGNSGHCHFKLNAGFFVCDDQTVIADDAHARGREILLSRCRLGFACRILEPVSVDQWSCHLSSWKQSRQAARPFGAVPGNACGRRQVPCRNPGY